MEKYDYSGNPYDKETQRKQWSDWRSKVRLSTDVKSGKITSMLDISEAISNFADRNRKG